MPPKILVVDDDPHIRDVVRYALENEGMRVDEAGNGLEGLERARSSPPDLMILDVMMPEIDGLTLCREFRRFSETPILFLSSRDEEIDRILGLEMGGDDYVSKPFSPRELVARIKVILKRRLPPPEGSSITSALLHRGQLVLNDTTYTVTWREASLSLTATEFNLLQTFMRHANKVYTRDELIQADIFKDIVSDRTIDSHIRRLRKKLAEAGCNDAIETVHGFGYKLGACD